VSFTAHPHFNEDTLINAAYALVAAFADRGYTSEQIKTALRAEMVDAYLAMRDKRDAQRYGALREGS
jgi:hypothetical protein